jgi:hypothetical protein
MRWRHGPQRSEDTRRWPSGARPLTLIEPDLAVGCHGSVSCLYRANQSPCAAARRGELAALCGWPARTLTACLVRALPVVARIKCGASCLSLVGLRICWRVGGKRDIPVDALFPEGRERFELGSSGWSWVLGSDAVGGPPHCDFANEGGAQLASRHSPDWLGVSLAGGVLDLVGEVGDELGSLCQVGPPDGMVVERWRYAWKPGQRTWVGRRRLGEAPVEDGGYIACGSKVTSGSGSQQVAEGVLPGFGRQGEQVRSQGRPRGLVGESGNVPVGLVELCPDGRRQVASTVSSRYERASLIVTSNKPLGRWRGLRRKGRRRRHDQPACPPCRSAADDYWPGCGSMSQARAASAALLPDPSPTCTSLQVGAARRPRPPAAGMGWQLQTKKFRYCPQLYV